MLLPPNEVRILSKEVLEQSDIDYFLDKYGKRFVRAMRAVEEGKVRKYSFTPSEIIRWTVVGRSREYLVIPEVFCSCRDFYQSVVIQRESKMCYHLLAQKIGEIRGQFAVLAMTDVDRRRLYHDWRKVS